MQHVAMAPVKRGLPVVTVCLKGNLISAAPLPPPNHQENKMETYSQASLDYFDKCLFCDIIGVLQRVRAEHFTPVVLAAFPFLTSFYYQIKVAG